jgi:hypothetical protein
MESFLRYLSSKEGEKILRIYGYLPIGNAQAKP